MLKKCSFSLTVLICNDVSANIFEEVDLKALEKGKLKTLDEI